MQFLLISTGVILLMFGSAVLILSALRGLLPDLNNMIPADWHKALSLQYGIYYVVAGLALVALPA
ncbi:MAG: hypothetical protein R3E95_02275 [Thiolinea sp.]